MGAPHQASSVLGSASAREGSQQCCILMPGGWGSQPGSPSTPPASTPPCMLLPLRCSASPSPSPSTSHKSSVALRLGALGWNSFCCWFSKSGLLGGGAVVKIIKGHIYEKIKKHYIFVFQMNRNIPPTCLLLYEAEMQNTV